MPTRLYSVVIDAADPRALARFWATATGWPVDHEDADESDVAPPEGEPGLPLVFVHVDEPKATKNRVHVDLASASADHQAELVDRLRRAGATPLDIGQGAVPWVVLADPEGNELCVLEPRPVYADAGAIAAIVVDTPDPHALAPFWEAASGWVVGTSEHGVGLHHPDRPGPWLELVPSSDPKLVKNRVHLDVAPWKDDDQAAEVARLTALGATPVDVGQGEGTTWTVLADPQGNELCVLRSRD